MYESSADGERRADLVALGGAHTAHPAALHEQGVDPLRGAQLDAGQRGHGLAQRAHHRVVVDAQPLAGGLGVGQLERGGAGTRGDREAFDAHRAGAQQGRLEPQPLERPDAPGVDQLAAEAGVEGGVRLQHTDPGAPRREGGCSGEARETGADDDHVARHGRAR